MAIMFQNTVQVTISQPEVDWLKFELDEEDRVREEREQMQHDIDQEFTDEEQSVLWKCLNDKTESYVHRVLNKIARRRITSTVPVELYRGVNKRMKAMIQGLEIDDEFEVPVVTSFSTSYSTARQFSSHSIYGTKTIFSLRNCPFAYNYQEDMLRLLHAAPDSEFSANHFDPSAKVDRRNKVEMVNEENEWMLPVGTKFRIVEIESMQTDPLMTADKIYHLEFISF